MHANLQCTGLFTGGRLSEARDLFLQNGSFAEPCEGEIFDAEGLYAIPGLIDLHFHGCAGYDFCDATAQSLDAISASGLSAGVTTICPAAMTYPEEKLAAICQNAAAWRGTGAAPAGLQLEGPFLSEAKKGAQNGAWLQKPDAALILRLQEQAHGMIRLLAVAPELPGALSMIRVLRNEVVVFFAHTEADYETAVKAFESGAHQVTHLYNAMPPFLHRNPGVIGAAFDTPECRVELICDGIHVHPSVVRATFQMFGDDRVILISDSMMATGLPDGTYALGGQTVFVAREIAVRLQMERSPDLLPISWTVCVRRYKRCRFRSEAQSRRQPSTRQKHWAFFRMRKP